MNPTYSQARFELDDVAKRLLERHGGDWKAAAIEAADAYHHFRNVIYAGVHADILNTGLLQHQGDRASVHLLFIPPEHRSPVTRMLLNE